MSLADELKKTIRGEVEDDPKILEIASRDASLFRVMPEVVVHPADADDVGVLVKFVTSKRMAGDAKISLTARSAGTDMSGGPLNDSIIVEMTRHLNHMDAVGDPSTGLGTGGHVVVEPGVYFRDFDKATQAKGYELPSYTASRELNTVGGMVANNSGGEKNLKYGKTARYVEELEVVLADGERHTLKNLSGALLEAKMGEQTYGGDLYRKMAALVRDHHGVIETNAPKVEKNSAGYALWDIGDGVHSLNLARLMVGAQGTLGIITKAKLGLVRPKPYAAMTVIFLSSLTELGEMVPLVLAHKPDSFESYDDHTFELAVRYFPEFAVQMKSGIIGLGLSFLPEAIMLALGGIPKLVLLAEFRADTQAAAEKAAQALAAEVRTTAKANKKDHIRVRVARTERSARKYWVIRRESFNLLRKKVRGKRTAPFIDDFVVPPATLPEFLPKLEDILSKYDLVYTVAGHVGDGNFHIIPLVDPTRPDLPTLIDELSHKVYDLVLSYHGSISGEHNDGWVRTPYVEKMFGSEMNALFVETKKIFDPHNIFNPGKKVGTAYADALKHLDLPPKSSSV